MLLVLQNHSTEEERVQALDYVQNVVGQLRLQALSVEGRHLIVAETKHIGRDIYELLAAYPLIDHVLPIYTPYKLVSHLYKTERLSVVVGDDRYCQAVTIGGAQSTPVVIAGPCAVESREQLLTIALAVKEAGGTILRGGAFKPRTSPYQFQGLGLEGLSLLAEMRELTGLPVVTEVMEPAMVEVVGQYTDMLQIGARNMQNYPLLQACGQQRLPVLLKRGLSATIDEWLLAAEYIAAAGNINIVLCERGIRSYDPHTRNVLDLATVPLLREMTYLPVIVDPSHATGKSSLVHPMARASIAAGADGVMIEAHAHPELALCDSHQAITPHQLEKIVKDIHSIAILPDEEEGRIRDDHRIIYSSLTLR